MLLKIIIGPNPSLRIKFKCEQNKKIKCNSMPSTTTISVIWFLVSTKTQLRFTLMTFETLQKSAFRHFSTFSSSGSVVFFITFHSVNNIFHTFFKVKNDLKINLDTQIWNPSKIYVMQCKTKLVTKVVLQQYYDIKEEFLEKALNILLCK